MHLPALIPLRRLLCRYKPPKQVYDAYKNSDEVRNPTAKPFPVVACVILPVKLVGALGKNIVCAAFVP